MRPGCVSMCMGMCICIFMSMCLCTVYIDSMCVCLYCMLMCLCMCVTIIFYSRSVQYVTHLVYDNPGQVSTYMIVIIIILCRPDEMYHSGIISRWEYHTYFWGDRRTGWTKIIMLLVFVIYLILWSIMFVLCICNIVLFVCIHFLGILIYARILKLLLLSIIMPVKHACVVICRYKHMHMDCQEMAWNMLCMTSLIMLLIIMGHSYALNRVLIRWKVWKINWWFFETKWNRYAFYLRNLKLCCVHYYDWSIREYWSSENM